MGGSATLVPGWTCAHGGFPLTHEHGDEDHFFLVIFQLGTRGAFRTFNELCRLLSAAHILTAAPTGRVRAGRTDGCVRECARRVEGPAAHA